MVKRLIIMLVMVGMLYGVSEAQVVPGTVNSKTLDGVGNKITSTVSGPSRGLDIVCLSGCIAGGGTSDVNVIQLLGVAPSATNPFPQRLSTGVAFYDARDRNWALAFGTDSVTVNSITNPVTVTGGTVASANIDGTCPSGAASFTVAASNVSRMWLAMWASPANTDDVFIKFGATATSADARLAPGQALNVTGGRIYTGVVDAFPNSGTQAVCVVELN